MTMSFLLPLAMEAIHFLLPSSSLCVPAVFCAMEKRRQNLAPLRWYPTQLLHRRRLDIETFEDGRASRSRPADHARAALKEREEDSVLACACAAHAAAEAR